VSSGASCSGSCAGTCRSSGGACTGDCHGDCSSPTSPPRCEGTLSCAVDPICIDACHTLGAEHAVCAGTPSFVVAGNEAIFAAYEKFGSDIGAALNETIALEDPITHLTTVIVPELDTKKGLSESETVCLADVLTLLGGVQASLAVSMHAGQAIEGR
jgi:hypothetical protein